jgi:predicted dehydrogenase
MLKIGIAGCGLQASTIASYLDVFGDEYEVKAVMDMNEAAAKQRLQEKQVKLSADCRFYPDINAFLAAKPELDGIIIGTYCTYHTEMACALEPLHIPLYIEKPVAVNLDQIRRLEQTFRNSKTPVQVSLPMRLCPLTMRAKEIIDSGRLGRIHQVVGFEDTDGWIYFSTWFRDAEKTGGMFMQKAVHDIDYLIFLSGIEPDTVCAMREKVCHVGNKDYEQTCADCPDKHTCEFGPEFCFDRVGRYHSVAEAEKMLSGVYSPDKQFLRKKYCVISRDIAIEDVGECIIRGKNGCHLVHTQNFIATSAAARRGARLVGQFGSLDIDFNHGELRFYSSVTGDVEHYKVNPGQLSHYGGDRQLVRNFIRTMKTGERSSTDLITGNGILSTLTCLCARESADIGQFVPIRLK